MASSELQSFFASIVDEASFTSHIEQKTKESLYLEFKTKKDRSKSDLDPSDAWQFSRALSGFANSDGGVLVWGIETNKQDEASKLKPISDVQGFVGRLKKSLLSTTQPVVDGVILEVIPTIEQAGAGYVKCLVPSSDKTPHRAMLADREYFKRTTEGFYRLEHFDLEDMFGRRPQPSLEVIPSLKIRDQDPSTEELRFALLNKGRGVAKYAGLLARFTPDVVVRGVLGTMENASNVNQGAPVISFQENVGVYHPNNIRYNIGGAVITRALKEEPLSVTVTVYCENMQPKTEILVVHSETVINTLARSTAT